MESNRIGDTFNKPFISNGVIASTTLADKYEEEHRKYGLIWSGIYNSTSGTNNLNQFIQAEKITKDLNPIYGSIQKLHTRDSDLVALCEDKILRILANKDALYNADGDAQLTATNLVLGTATPFVGEYGISRNPESFASEAYRCYFTDKVRGAVMRLSRDGLTAISDHGMKDWFKDNLKLAAEIHGSYDDRKDEYNVTLIKPNLETGGEEIVLGPGMSFFMPQFLIEGQKDTITFREDVTGWVSFKSFTPENAISCANEYFTFHNGQLWQHHVELFDDNNKEYNRNTFYNIHHPSSINVLINEDPSAVKTFNTINYEGSQAKIDQFLNYNTYQPGTDVITGTHTDNQYYNIEDKLGWYVESVTTDQEKGGINEFIEKEGKWFNYIKGTFATSVDVFNNVQGGFYPSDTAFQGLGRVSSSQVAGAFGCTDDSTIVGPDGNTYPAVINYNATATVDDGSCTNTAFGCMDPLSDGVGLGPQAYNAMWNTDTDPTYCIYNGCMDPSATNYNPSANTNDNSCVGVISGCTDPTAWNFNNNANTDDGSCVSTILGCIDNTADNYCSTCNTDDGSCLFTVIGCTDPNSCDYDANANTDDGSCTYCNDVTANNFDSSNCNTYCEYCETIDWNPINVVDITGYTAKLQWTIYPDMLSDGAGGSILTAPPLGFEVELTPDGGTPIILTIDTSGYVFSPNQTFEFPLNNLTSDTNYSAKVKTICSNSTSAFSQGVTFTTQFITVYGCTQSTYTNANGSWPMCQYNPNANTDDGSCDHFQCFGCTDPTAFNYDPNATIPCGYLTQDGDLNNCCQPVVPGCTDPNAYNYNSSANTDDGSCGGPPIYGCMDDTIGINGSIAALNYDPSANTDDGSCTYDIHSGTVDWVNAPGDLNTELVITVGNLPNDASISLTGLGYVPHAVYMYTAPAIANNAYMLLNQTGVTIPLQDGVNTYTLFSIPTLTLYSNFHYQAYPDKLNRLRAESVTIERNGQELLSSIPNSPAPHFSNMTVNLNSNFFDQGCMDVTACNFDPNATLDAPASCVYGAGCSDSTALEYDANLTCPDNTNDCSYCSNDAGIETATATHISDAITGTNQMEVTWSDIGTGDANHITYAHQLFAGDGAGSAYIIQYRYKIPGQGWSSWEHKVDMMSDGTIAGSTDGGPHDPTSCTWNWNTWNGHGNGQNGFKIIITDNQGEFGPNDGRFDSGVKWRLRVKNICTDCSSSSTYSWSPIFTIPSN